jgi:hypothetical protein
MQPGAAQKIAPGYHKRTIRHVFLRFSLVEQNRSSVSHEDFQRLWPDALEG